MGQVITIANQKGGVGKTTTAVNLSSCIAAAGEKTCLLIDCDPQGNATTGLGVDRESLPGGLYNLLLGQGDEDGFIVRSGVPGLDLIGVTSDLIGAEVELASMENKEFRLRKALTDIRKKYDYIFLDCPPSLGFLTVNALTAADSVLIPLQCEYYALEGLSQLLNTIKAVRKGLNPTLRFSGILLTMYDQRNNLSKQILEDVQEHFKGRVFRTAITRNVRLSEAPSYGKPVIMYDISSKGAQSYLALAKEFIGGTP